MARAASATAGKGRERAEAVGKVVTPARLENNSDLALVAAGLLPAARVRRLEVADALVDTGATTLCLPTGMIAVLGLRPVAQRMVKTAGGDRRAAVYSDVLLTIQDREAVVRVIEVPDGAPVLIGQIPLEEMDLVPIPSRRALVPNPEHGGQWVSEMY